VTRPWFSSDQHRLPDLGGLSHSTARISAHRQPLIVTGKGSKQRAVYLTAERRAGGRWRSTSRALRTPAWRSHQTSTAPYRTTAGRRLTGAGARFIVRRLRKELGAWSFQITQRRADTTATTLSRSDRWRCPPREEVLATPTSTPCRATRRSSTSQAGRIPPLQEFLDGKKPPD